MLWARRRMARTVGSSSVMAPSAVCSGSSVMCTTSTNRPSAKAAPISTSTSGERSRPISSTTTAASPVTPAWLGARLGFEGDDGEETRSLRRATLVNCPRRSARFRPYSR